MSLVLLCVCVDRLVDWGGLRIHWLEFSCYWFQPRLFLFCVMGDNFCSGSWIWRWWIFPVVSLGDPIAPQSDQTLWSVHNLDRRIGRDGTPMHVLFLLPQSPFCHVPWEYLVLWASSSWGWYNPNICLAPFSLHEGTKGLFWSSPFLMI